MPTPAADARLNVTARLREKRIEHIVLDIPGTDYRLHLMPETSIKTAVGGKITGRIHVQARRVDPIRSGGRFIEPGYGRPRRVQGRILGGDPETNQLYVHCGGAAVIATLMSTQKATDFAFGQIVLFDVERGATFEPV
jgi:hypothetical protein